MKALGIDTSNYVTSVALVDSEGHLSKDLRSPLTVSSGEKGLRQSEALFRHTKNLPLLLAELFTDVPATEISGIVVSAWPRRREGSYMPVFLAGHGQAKVLASALGVPLLERSHQEGHLYAALSSASLDPAGEEFLALHLSGGTSELLKVTPLGSTWPGFELELLGGSSDLHAGQFVDGVGVALGLPFPAGPALEELARGAQGDLRLSTSLSGLSPSFSGPTTQALKLIKDGAKAAEVAMAVQNALVKVLEKWLLRAYEETRLNRILLSGGVTANTYLRTKLPQRLRKRGLPLEVFFGHPRLSGDNAVGLAFSYWYPGLTRLEVL